MDNFLSNIGNFAKGTQGLTDLQTGADLEVAGAKMNAQAYRSAGIVSQQTAQYNIAINKLEFNRQMDVMGRTISTTFSQNRAVQGASGFSYGSKSYLAVQNRVFSTYERTIQQAKTSHEQQNAMIKWEGDLAKVENENKARAAEYQGQVAQYQADVARADGFGSLIKQGISSFMLGK